MVSDERCGACKGSFGAYKYWGDGGSGPYCSPACERASSEQAAALEDGLAAIFAAKAWEALEAVDQDVRHHLRSDEVHTALIRPDAIRKVREALALTQVGRP